MNLSSEYLIAWSIYYLAAIGCCVVWWKITSKIGSRSLREVLRGLAVVLAFTPWYAGETVEFWAPAVVVLMMDILLEGTAAGLKGGVVLLITTFLMLLVLLVRALLRRRKVAAVEPASMSAEATDEAASASMTSD